MLLLLGHIQYKYAQANYPNTWGWRAILFVGGFIPGGIGALTFEMNSVSFVNRGLFILFLGVFLGLISAFLVPINMRNILPKRKE
jgi:hypothetical protein